ncbi:MAG: kelch repeat-containing protein [Bacteroidia bacterium]
MVLQKKHSGRNFLLLTGMFLLLLVRVNAQGGWVSKSSLSTASGRASPVAFTIQNKAYVAGGDDYTGSYLNDCWCYDPVADTWTQVANFGGGPRGYAAGFSIGNFGYMGSGADGTGTLYNDFWKYDPILNTWTLLPGNTMAARSETFAFSLNGKGYVGTGKDGAGNCLTDIWEFNPAGNTWTTVSTFPGGARRSIDRAVFILNNKAYLGTGCNVISGTFYQYNDFWEFDPVSYTWTQKANVPGPGRRGAVGFTACHSGFLGLGADAGTYLLNDFYEYDPSSNTWSVANAFPGIKRWDMVAFNIGNEAYMFGGATYSSTALPDLWSFSRIMTPVISPYDSICAGTSITLHVSGGNAFLWNTGATSDSIIVTPPSTTTYSVRVTNGCYIDSVGTIITVFNASSAGFTYHYEPCSDKCIQFLNQAVNAISYNWDFGDGTSSQLPNPCHYYKDSSNYPVTLHVDNSTNCQSAETMPVHYFAFDTTAGIFIPSLFSPNGDGKNDRLFFYKHDSYCMEYFEISIYDRWGERVFYTNNIEGSWDGTSKGEPLNTGTFVYCLKLDTKSGIHRELKGSISLVR